MDDNNNDGFVHYILDPDGPNPEDIGFKIITHLGDYILILEDFIKKKRITFRWCMSGEESFHYPKTTLAIANLARAFEEEVNS